MEEAVYPAEVEQEAEVTRPTSNEKKAHSSGPFISMGSLNRVFGYLAVSIKSFPRLDMKALIILEISVVLLFFGFASMMPEFRQGFGHVCAMVFVLFLFHVVVVPFKGLSFVIWNADPTSTIKYYYFFSIGAAVYLGGFLRDAVFG